MCSLQDSSHGSDFCPGKKVLIKIELIKSDFSSWDIVQQETTFSLQEDFHRKLALGYEKEIKKELNFPFETFS